MPMDAQYSDHEPCNDVLLQMGDFRLVRDPAQPGQCMIQHSCDNRRQTNSTYCDLKNGWCYCWSGEKQCAGCGTAVPEVTRGIFLLHNWER
jgi:hypothetical protein